MRLTIDIHFPYVSSFYYYQHCIAWFFVSRARQQLSSKPKKSILKKSNSYTIHAFDSNTRSTPAVGDIAKRMQEAMDESK